MQKTVLVLISLIFAASLVLASPGTAQAFDWTAPVVTPVSGDSEFSATPTAITNLPGIISDDNGLILPAGFPEGSAQFGGDAVVVRDLIQGSAAKVCYSMPAKRTQWEGSVFLWDGSKWARLVTTVNYGGEETAAGTACTEIYGDGTYALIMGYTGKPEPKGLPVCTEPIKVKGFFLIGYGPDSSRAFLPDKSLGLIMWLILSGDLPIGTPVTYQILNATPPSSLGGKFNQTSQVSEIIPSWGSRISFFDVVDPLTFPTDEWITSDNFFWYSNITMRFIFPNCYVDVTDALYLARPR